MISVDDVAALAVVADRHSAFKHHLDVRHMDIKWILDEDADGTSPTRFRHPGSPVLPQTADGKFPKPPSLSLDQVDWASVPADEIDSHKLLVSTPRSVLVPLKLGLGLRDLLASPTHSIRNQALLDGISDAELDIRMKSEDERRKNRRSAVMKMYQTVCGVVASKELVEAIRAHKFAAHRQDARNAAAVKRMKALAPAGKLDVSTLDDECVEVVKQTRERAMQDISRVIEQSQRQQTQRLEREAAIIQRQRELEGESKASNIHRERILNSKKQELAEKRKFSESRTKELLTKEHDKFEARRAAIIERREEVVERVSNRKAFEKNTVNEVQEEAEKHREEIRKREKELVESRRDLIEAKSFVKEKTVEENLQELRESRTQRKLEHEKSFDERRRAISEMKRKEEEEAAARLEQIIKRSEQRSEEVNQARQDRMKNKREVARMRHDRGTEAKERCRQQEEARTKALEEEHARKRDATIDLDRMRSTKSKHVRETNHQVRLDRTDERNRCKSAQEFHYVGYTSANLEKTHWMEREQSKRKSLAVHVRQEREALSRAQQAALREMEMHEMRMRRQFAFGSPVKHQPLAAATTTETNSTTRSQRHSVDDGSPTNNDASVTKPDTNAQPPSAAQ